jgi:DNA-directed RNA polymerase specialized sigma24 family protein
MISTCDTSTADAWLHWFDTTHRTACRTYLCTRYHLDALDAEALMNTARLQVFRHWATLEHPLSYFWRTLRHALGKQGQRRTRELQQLAAYAQQCQVESQGAARTAAQVADVLARVPPRQRCLLAWCAQGYEDTQVAAWMGMTPQAVRVARQRAYRTLRAQHHVPKGGVTPQQRNCEGL